MEAIFKLTEIQLIHAFGTTITIGSLLSCLLVVGIGFSASKSLRKWILANAAGFNIEQSMAHRLATVANYVGVTATLLIAVSLLGIDIQNLMIIAGALSVGIGFGLQNIANNFVSGIILLFDRSLQVGDYVELADGLRGVISQVRVRSTIIMTNDGMEVIVPNSKLLSDQVINYTLSDDCRRLHVPFGVAYGSDVEKVVSVVQAAAKKLPFVALDNPEHEPAVWMTGMGDSSLNFELLLWIRGKASYKPSGILSTCLLEVHKTLVKNDITIPFPQLDLHVKR